MNLTNKNVLVTGGAGFIGSTLVRKLLQENSNVIVYDNFSGGDISNLSEIKNDITILEGDVRDKDFKNAVHKNNIEFIFNLAAEPFIPYCYKEPENFFEVNANGTLNVLLAAKDAGVKRVLHYSSSEVYGSAQHVPMNEDHPTLPLSTYAVSKLAADRLCFTLYHEQNVPVIILRQFNVYGPRETFPYIVPELISQLAKNNKLKLGNINARRDLTYVEDAAEGAIELIKCKKAEGETVNLGYGEDFSIKELAQIIGELMGHNSIEIKTDERRFRPLDVQRLCCDYSKAKKLIGWKPMTTPREGLMKTIEWFRENNSRWIWETKYAPEDMLWKK